LDVRLIASGKGVADHGKRGPAPVRHLSDGAAFVKDFLDNKQQLADLNLRHL
jgi:hypothetical protein